MTTVGPLGGIEDTTRYSPKSELPRSFISKEQLRPLLVHESKYNNTMAVEVKEDAAKKGFFGTSKKKLADEKEPQQVTDDDNSTEDKEKTSPGKTWLGIEKKKPRAEYQAEIDALTAKLAALEEIRADRDLQTARVIQLTREVNSFKTWARQAPSLELR